MNAQEIPEQAVEVADDALQALLDMGEKLSAGLRQNPDGTHTTDDEWAWLLMLSASTVHLIRDLREARRQLAAVKAVHFEYFDMDGKPGFDDTTPEPEDVWRYDRDFRAALSDAADTETTLHEQGRRLASERDDLIATGVDPARLEIPIAPAADAAGDGDRA